MQTCEQCGKSFEQSNDLTEVTTLRILCPACTAERAARKKMQAAAAGGGGSSGSAANAAPRGVARPSSSAAPAARPSAPRAASPKPSEPPAKPAARPVPARPSRAEDAAPPARSKPARVVRDEDDEPPARARASKTSKSNARAKREAREHRHHSGGHYVAEQEKKMVMIGWIAAGVLLVVCGAFIFHVYQRTTREAEILREIETRDERFRDEVKAVDFRASRAAAEALIKKINDNREELKSSRFKGEITEIAANAAAFVAQEIERERLSKDMADVQTQLASVAALSGDQLIELRRRLDELNMGAAMMGEEFQKQITDGRAKIEANYLKALVSDAEKLATAGPENARAALGKFARAEDETQKAYGEAFNKGDQARQTELRELYQSICQRSDELVYKTFNDAVVASTPWKDLLNGDAAKKWIASETPGFNWRVENGVLEINFPDEEAKSTPVISIGDNERWRDFVLECEFVILNEGRDDPVYFFRAPAGKIEERTVINQRLFMSSDGGLQTNQKYTMTASFLGNRIKIGFEPEDYSGIDEEMPTYSHSRKGGVALAIPAGTQMRITKMQIKELRSTVY